LRRANASPLYHPASGLGRHHCRVRPPGQWGVPTRDHRLRSGPRTGPWPAALITASTLCAAVPGRC